MKAGTSYVIYLSLSLAVATETQPAETAVESNGPSSGSAVRGQIMELLKQDVAKIPLKPKDPVAPFLNPDAAATDQPVEEGVLELEPIAVTQKRAIELPPRPLKPTLENFFYGDGAIWKSADGGRTLSAGSYGNGLAAIKFTLKF